MCPGVKIAHFCELMWQAWAITSFSLSLRSQDTDLFLTEAFSPRKRRVPFLLSPADSVQDTEVCKIMQFAVALGNDSYSPAPPMWGDCTYLENLETQSERASHKTANSRLSFPHHLTRGDFQTILKRWQHSHFYFSPAPHR